MSRPTSEPEVVAVALNRPLSKAYSYSVPEKLRGEVPVGALVEVPLRGQKDIGCVVAHDPSDAPRRLKAIRRRASPGYSISKELIELGRWMAEYYFCGWGEALATLSMIGFGDLELKSKSVYRLAPDWKERHLTKRQREVAGEISQREGLGPLPLTELARAVKSSPGLIHKLADTGALIAEEQSLPPPEPLAPRDQHVDFLPEQKEAFDAIEAVRGAGEFGVFLLHGVTGSGKTEVYLRLIERVFAQGKSALCLVPEISLTPQTVDRFARRFQEEVGVFHSQMTRREKRVLHEKIQRGMIRLVIGARSATFAPLPKLGIIIIDEEHETSYKQSETPRYHARDTAIVRASRLKIPVLLGSATPSLESYENALRGKYTLLKLRSRPAGLQMPDVRIIPMGRKAVENPTGISLLSEELKSGIENRLDKGEQVLIFLNRRGFSNFLMCPSCKWVARCDDDDIVMTIHQKKHGRKKEEELPELELFPKPLESAEAYIKCHFCGRTSDYPEKCPNCGEEGLAAVGTGTQRIEEALRRTFPDRRILRLDQDSVGGRRGFLKAWQDMVSGDAEIILGTQMIAKGLHLERVTLVGVILAEVGLFVPDFRSEERTFSLLMQVAGRSGRKDMGEVVLQTYMAHHAAIQMASRHDYEAFFEVEMERRRKMRFPPVERLIALTLSDGDLGRALGSARSLGGILRRLRHRENLGSVHVIGPTAAPIERLAGRFRQRLLLRAANAYHNAGLLRAALNDRQWNPSSTTRLTIDVDPLDLL